MPATINCIFSNQFPGPLKPAFRRAAATWSQVLNSNQPIRIYAIYGIDLPGTLHAMCISQGRENVLNAPAMLPDTWYVSALAKKLANQDIAPNEPDMTILFRRKPTPNNGWWGDENGPMPNDRYDFESVALHEMGHGFGFVGLFWVDPMSQPPVGSYGANAILGRLPQGVDLHFQLPNDLRGHPTQFGRKVIDGSGLALTGPKFYTNNSTALGTALTIRPLRFSIPGNPNGGHPLYVVNPFRVNSSVEHLDIAGSLMSPAITPGTQRRAVDQPVRDVMTALGW
jgi:hypothetical protein